MPPKRTKLEQNHEAAYSLWLIELSDAKAVLNDPDSVTQDDLENSLQTLREAYDELKKATAFCLTDDNSKILQAAAEEFHQLRKVVNAQVKGFQAVEDQKQKDKAAKVSNKPSYSSSAVQLKKLSCPTWDGDIRSYKRFRKNFELLVESQMSADLALLRLRDSLKSDSREGLLAQTKSTLPEAWQALDNIYGRANSIKDAVLRDVQEVRAVRDESDADGLRRLVTELTLAREDLKAVKRESALGESAFSVVMAKIPVKLRREIDEKILEDDLDSQESFELLIKLADKAASVEEVARLRAEAHMFSLPDPRLESENFSKNLQLKSPAGDDRGNWKPPGGKGGSGGYDKSRGRMSGNRGGTGRKKPQDTKGESFRDSPPPSMICVLHPTGDHQTAECRVFLGQSSEEKKKTLKGGKRCEKCFYDHQVKDCKSRHECKEKGCKSPQTHHTLIHAACLSVSLSVKSAGSAQSKPKNQVETNQLHHHLGHTTLRPSHKAYLKQKGRLVEVSILYDLGATVSQIQESVAQKVDLKPVNVVGHLMMKTAGKTQAEDWGPTKLYNVPLFDSDGTLVMIINCIGVSYIGDLDGGSYGTATKLFKDHGLDPSTLLKPVDGPIEILIGDNHAGVFPHTVTSRGNIVLAETKFGQILHGSHSTFFAPRTNAEGMLLSGALDLAAHSLSLAVSKDSPVSNCIPDLEPQSQGQPLTPEAKVFTVKARSTSSDTGPGASEDAATPTSMVFAVKTSEETAFDRLCALENSPVCYKCEKCEKCPPESSPEEGRRLKVYKSCLTYDPERKVFVCRLPWKEDFKTLADNRQVALKRLNSLTRSMGKDDHLKAWYVDEFEKLIQAGYMEEVTEKKDEEWKSKGGNAYYICHFAHLNEHSASTPLRVIFDASVPFRGLAINSLWEPPPNLIPPIPMLLLRFQERKVPIAMDISKAYFTVHLDTDESHLHRLLWNQLEMERQVKTFRLLRNSWGTTPAGGICSVAMLVIAEKFREEFPDVYEFVKSNLYVDDGTSSVDDVKSALVLARDLSHVLGQASFKVKHFMIGGKDLNIDAQIQSFDEVPSSVRPTEDQERILGVIYHSESDEISISARVNFSKKKRGVRTKADVTEEMFDAEFPEKFSLRMYLQNIATVYDPTGLCTPATVVMKHELGQIFRLKLDWDDPISEGDDSAPTTRSRCKEIVRNIYGLKKVRFSRCLTPDDAIGDPVLVVFCDSSQNAYGCAAYYNWRLKDGSRESRLAMAKAKPWPKSPVLTIPRGEMSGCLMGARIKNAIVQKTSFKFERVIMLTDSTIVLGQLRHEPYKFNIWTATRVDEIQRLTMPDEWFHVESDNNVADDASRGLDTSQMGRESRWQTGPSFMKKTLEKWPIIRLEELQVRKEEESTDLRLKDPRMVIGRSKSMCLKISNENPKSSNEHASEESENDASSEDEDPSKISRHSEKEEENHEKILHALETLDIKTLDRKDSWPKAKRRISRIIRFIETAHDLFKSKLQKRLKIKIPDFKKMTRSQQSQWYSENDNFVPTKREMAISALFLTRKAQSSLPDDVQRSLGALNPLKDVDGIWRAVGRTGAAKGNPPILVPRAEPLAEVLVRHYHCPQHSGSDTTLALVRQQYWIIDGQRFVNSYVSKCACCRFLRKQISQVEIAPRKVEQLLRSPVFQHVILDIAGPFSTVADRRETRSFRVQTGKVWILVIVCRATGAVHIEVLEGYDTNNFLAGFDAFTRLRGKPSSVTADLGSQIRSAANVMESPWSHTKMSKVQNDPENITWYFVPSGAHSSVGQAERMIRVVKNTLEAVTLSRKPEFTKLKLQRLMYGIADIINDRPLGVHRTKAGKLDADRLLRPNDLILGRSNGNISQLMDFNLAQSAEKMDYTEIVTANEKFLDLWWRKWYDQIFPILLPREKWTHPARGVLKGDIVIIRDTNPIRNSWSWGEVETVNKSSDGVIRTVAVRYKLDNKSKFVTKSVRDLVVILRNEERDE